jgi:hypothetical protein
MALLCLLSAVILLLLIAPACCVTVGAACVTPVVSSVHVRQAATHSCELIQHCLYEQVDRGNAAAGAAADIMLLLWWGWPKQ